MAKGLLEPRPLCLLGPGWEAWWRLFEAEPGLVPRLDLVSRASDPRSALDLLAAGPAARVGPDPRGRSGVPSGVRSE